MSKSLQNIRDHVRVYLDEAVQADWTDAQINREINNKYFDCYSAVITLFEDYYSTKSYITTVTSQQEYALPTDFLKMRRVEVNWNPSDTNSIPVRVSRISMDDVLRDMGNQGTSLTPHARPGYYLRGNYIGFIPLPTEGGTNACTLWYVATIVDLTGDSETINLPFADNYASIIALGAAGELLRKGQQEEAVAAQYLKEYQFKIGKMQEELKERQSDGARTITDVVGTRLDFGDTMLF